MRTVYKATFSLGRAGEPPPQAGLVAESCLNWMFSRRGVSRPEALPQFTETSFDQLQVGDGAYLESVFTRADGRSLAGIRLTHGDTQQPGAQWQTELLIASRDGLAEDFSCVNRFGSEGDVLLPARREPSRPRIVRDLLERYGGRAGHELSSRAHLLRADGARDFLQALTSADRKRPILLVTARNHDDRPIADAEALADWAAGLAHVYVAENRFPSLDLGELLPRRLNCWDGAVRIYWPGFRPSDDPFRHRVWAPLHVRDLDSTQRHGFKSHVLGYLCEVSAYAVSAGALTWETVEVQRREALMGQLKDRGEVAELYAMADQQATTLRDEKGRLELEVLRLAEELHECRQREASWKEAYLQLRRVEAGGSPGEDVLLPVDSVADAIDRASTEFPELVFSLNGQSSADDSPYKSGEEVYAAFEWLATTYYQARVGAKACPDFDLSLRDALGWWYEPHQSEVTMSKYRNWYTTKWEGRTYWIPEHIGTGSSKDPHRTIRIGFDWDRERQKVVVGFIGQHQKTDAT